MENKYLHKTWRIMLGLVHLVTRTVEFIITFLNVYLAVFFGGLDG